MRRLLPSFPWLAGLLLWCLAVAVPSPARAQAPVWGEIDLPGGVTAARQVLNLGTETRTQSAFLVDFIRTFHQFGDVDSTAIQGFEHYLRYVQELRAGLAAWPDGLQLGTEKLQNRNRDRWRAVAELLALRLREVKNRPVLELDKNDDAQARVVWLKALGIDPAALVKRLNANERVRLAIAVDPLPLPLPGIWPALLDQQGRVDVVQLGASHRPALLYIGLMSLDAETLAFFGSHPEALDLDMAEAGTFAAFGRSLHVRGGRIQLPGGAAYAPAWVQLVDRRIDETVPFIRRLLSRDDGRLAFFYDTVAHLDAPRQTALFAGAQRTADQIEVMERHYRWFKDVDDTWKVGTRPFFRPAFDPALALTLLDLDGAGTVGAPWWPHVLGKIVDDDGWPDTPIKDLEERRADVTWALAFLFDSKAAGDRFRLLRFAQRRFATAPKTDAPHVEVALRGFSRMPVLLLTLERIGVVAPPVFAEVASAGMRLTLAGDVEHVGPALRTWQAALSIVEQVARRRVIPPAARDGLLLSLARLVPAEGLPEPGAIATWVVDQLNPALGVPAAGTGDYEVAALAAWLAPATAATRTLSWEGLDYRIDRVGPVLRDALAVRAGAKGPTLTHLELLVRTRREMAAGVKGLDRVKDLAARLEAIRKELLELVDDKKKPLYDTGDLEDAARTIARIRRDKDLNRVPKQIERLDRAFAAVTDHVLPALAYALAAAPTAQPQIYADIALRHVVTASPDLMPDQWRVSTWLLPRSGTLTSGSAGIMGSLLGLDTALADGQLRRLAVADASAPPVEGKFNPFDREAITARLLFASPLDDMDTSAAATMAALTAGEARWRDLTSATTPRPDAEAALAKVVGETRANLVLWQRDRVDATALAELVLPAERLRLGATDLPLAIGMVAAPFDGCLCLRPPIDRPIAHWLGRGTSGHQSVLVVDVQVRLVQALAELKLPFYLAELLLPMALQDTVDRVGQFSTDDWEALAVARFIPTPRVEEYLLALVAEGVLAPPAKAAPER